MTRALFSDGWTFRRADGGASAVRLPHDAMIGETRVPVGGTDGHGGFFPGGAYVYERAWTVPDDAGEREYRLHFEGVFGRARVLIDGAEVAECDSPYREFSAPLSGVRPGTTVVIRVEVDNTAVPRSRWYTGSGIYRPVWLESRGPVRWADDGIAVVTSSLTADEAVVDVRLTAEGAQSARARVEFCRGGEVVATEDVSVVAGRALATLRIPQPRPWSAEHPHLYDVRVALVANGVTVDERHVRAGLRTIDVDSRRGLRINGTPVLLRGAAVHHDNGLLGAATFADAERRRVRILKDAGYNAIRSAHNPLSRAFLDACDELGMYVMDELTDVWFGRKTPHDESARFDDVWRDDAASMIAKDRNRPCVLMYSIGNEIAEVGWRRGVDTARAIHTYVTTSDPTRPTTIASNPLLVMMAGKEQDQAALDDKSAPERKPATSTAANMLTAKLGRMMVLASLLPAADKATRDVFDVVDIAGYNYAYASYAGARRRYPDRVILGTESMPGDLAAIWKRVTAVPGVIGDFCWTGWDYLGEVGLGYWTYGNEPGGISKPYPGVLAGAGVFDITGRPAGAMLLLAQAVWGIADAPGIAVRPLDAAGRRANRTPWLSSDAVQSWSWGHHRATAEVEVYSGDDRVELLLNGRSLGRRRAGAKRGFVARFRVPYEPGELVAVGYRDGVETGRSALRTAVDPTLRVRAEDDQVVGADGLAYVWIEIADDTGAVDATSDDRIEVTVSGPAVLQALGTARPQTEETFVSAGHTLHRGRVLAIVRGTGEPGAITVTARGRHGSASTTLTGVLAPERKAFA